MTISHGIRSITAAAAARAAEAALACGAGRGAAVVAAVVDHGGHLLALLRADGAFTASLDMARDKAWTAATFGMSTDRLCALVDGHGVLRDGIGRRPGVILFGGGTPLLEEGHLIGAIGVSGGSEDDDRACAEAGIKALGL
ncbi:heme-binding protein [Xanthobacter sp. 126]|jgi:uncharacterized protein GlcG (DUF336 family)|uniref:GlcG/HbpS family heme-binding protein n=1 Tax=Xanthobacter sp. 126 TaxID=1131814 RepID=UPI00045EABB1|nr:heme-binding protein [Xanthobacter sp. 126]